MIGAALPGISVSRPQLRLKRGKKQGAQPVARSLDAANAYGYSGQAIGWSFQTLPEQTRPAEVEAPHVP